MEEKKKSVGIYCFSATGNTLRVCKLIKEQLEALGAEVRIMKVEDGYNEDISSARFDTFAEEDPVHGFNSPHNVVDFAGNFPEGAKGSY